MTKEGESHNFQQGLILRVTPNIFMWTWTSKVGDNVTTSSCYGSKYKLYADIPAII